MTTRLASLRLAPMQAASWGHAETTGLPTIDYYLSAEALEPEGADAHYTECLIQLPSLGTCCEPLRVEPVPPDLSALGLADRAHLLLCPGNPQKYSPASDHIWVEIARRVTDATLVFFGDPRTGLSGLLHARLSRAFADYGVDFSRSVSFVPVLDRARFFGLMQAATIYLDSVDFSGFNTALQAIEVGLPVVAMEGHFLRSRLASGILKHLDTDDLVTTSAQQYVDLAIELTKDSIQRLSASQRIESSRQAIFEDTQPIRFLEEFIEQAG